MPANRLLQSHNGTFLGRYWTEHSLLRRYVPSDRDLAILSFGCSTGEELATIRQLFPGANLYGCDVNWHNLQAARALTGPSVTVFESSDGEVVRHGPYDIILCNSVLLAPTTTHGSRVRGLDPALWRGVLHLLHETLKPGGLLQIINSNVPFRYHPVAAQYRALRSPLVLGPNFVDQFDPDDRCLCWGVSGSGRSSVLSRHLGGEGWRELQPGDLHDVHFQKAGGTRSLEPVEDECLPNCPSDGDGCAFGTSTYRPHLPPDPRPSSHVEVDVTWKALDVDIVRLERIARRIWFDGSGSMDPRR
jgi:hypothetical protein